MSQIIIWMVKCDFAHSYEQPLKLFEEKGQMGINLPNGLLFQRVLDVLNARPQSAQLKSIDFGGGLPFILSGLYPLFLQNYGVAKCAKYLVSFGFLILQSAPTWSQSSRDKNFSKTFSAACSKQKASSWPCRVSSNDSRFLTIKLWFSVTTEDRKSQLFPWTKIGGVT